MKFDQLREELCFFYDNFDPKAFEFNEKCRKRLDETVPEGISAYEQKAMQYETIADMCKPVIFHNSSFYYEIATMTPVTQGEGCCSRSTVAPHHPGGWLADKNEHKYEEANPELYKRSRVDVYSWCGSYGDDMYHFSLNMKPVLEGGLKSVYEKIENALEDKCTKREKEFLQSCQRGILAIKKISEKFSAEAERMLSKTDNVLEKKRLARIAKSAAKTPWEAPENFYEALNTVALLSKAVGALEGVNLTDMGRLDANLYQFYKKDTENGIFTKEEIYDLIYEYTLTWHCHGANRKAFDRIESYEGYVYTLGGCDREGKEVYNDITDMFLEANYEVRPCVFKIKCRYGKNSPKEYLKAVNKATLAGHSNMLYLNDDALIPAFVRAGADIHDARDYTVLGCWEPVIPGCTNEHCGYVNLIKIFEYSIYGDWKHENIKINSIGDAADFEEVYKITAENIIGVLSHKCESAYKGRQIWSNVNPMLLISSVLEGCIEKKRDYTEGGAKSQLDELICAGIVNVINSLLSIKELCFERKKYTLGEFIDAVKNNWNGHEKMRSDALGCSFWGDESEESGALMARLCGDIYKATETFPSLYGGRVTVGYMLYLEMYRWAKKLRATPDGRHDYDYFERGFTPSAMHTIKSATSVINSMRAIDASMIAANSVVNMTLPLKPGDDEVFASFMLSSAQSAAQALQINCVTKEELEEAMRDPANHTDIVVRVCGFSAKFISLPDEIQKEFMTRNFYEN